MYDQQLASGATLQAHQWAIIFNDAIGKFDVFVGYLMTMANQCVCQVS